MPDGESLLVYRIDFKLAVLDLTDGKMGKDFGMERYGWGTTHFLQQMLLTIDGEYLWTSNDESRVSQWSFRDKALVQASGLLKSGIYCICD
jgi:hypothetical protein